MTALHIHPVRIRDMGAPQAATPPPSPLPSSQVLKTCPFGLIASQQLLVPAAGRAGYSTRLKGQSLALGSTSAQAYKSSTAPLPMDLNLSNPCVATSKGVRYKVHSSCLWPVLMGPELQTVSPADTVTLSVRRVWGVYRRESTQESGVRIQ